MKIHMVLAVTAVCSMACAARAEETVPWATHGPLGVSENGRYLAYDDGTPLLWIADTGWALYHRLDRKDAIRYLDDRKEKGFNVIQAVVYWYPHGEDGPGPLNPKNAHGHRPFVGGENDPDTSRPLVVEGGSPDEPNDYWDNVDFIVRETRARGLHLAFLPCWGRAFINGQMDKSRVVFDENSAREYGRFLGQRYGDEPHIVWVFGGDVNPISNDLDQRGVYRAMVEGVAQGAIAPDMRWNKADPRWDSLLMTYHPDGDWRFNSSDWFHADPWLDMNGIETWKSVDRCYDAVAKDYALADPIKPTLQLEGAYEGGNYPEPGGLITALKARRQAYHSFFAGAAGFTYGASPMWPFRQRSRGGPDGKNWIEALGFPGAVQTARILPAILRDNGWPDWAPDASLLVAGRGNGETLKAAVIADHGTRAVIYFPDTSEATIRLAKLEMSGQVRAVWIDPRDGSSRDGGSFAGDRDMTLRPPTDWEDAILVVHK